MPRYTVVVDHLADWPWPRDGIRLLTVDAFLDEGIPQPGTAQRVVVLCRRYGYLTGGYYCSLLAEARGLVPMPTVGDVLSLSRRSLVRIAVPDLEQLLQQTMRRLRSSPASGHVLHVFCGQTDDTRFRRLAAACFDVFRFPVLRVQLELDGANWRIAEIKPLGIHRVPADLREQLYQAVRGYTRSRRSPGPGFRPALYNLAILQDPAEVLPPSNDGALQKFERIGEGLRIDVERISRRDAQRIPEFDALFVRATTAIDHYTYQFARKAELEGLAVMDDTQSILRCANKVYLHELLLRHQLPAPRTETINRATFDGAAAAALADRLGLPMVLKVPDGSFSRGAIKAETLAQLSEGAAVLMKSSRLILAQEFVYTGFDWRVGVLRGEPLFVCQYMMSRNHWQIIRHGKDGRFTEGAATTLPIEAAPADVVQTAVRAARLVGDGLYGVDVKQTDKGVLVIEVNDNPNIDRGIEDQVAGDRLYETILKDFIRRIDET